VAVVVVETAVVLTVNVAEVDPAGTVTVLGTLAFELPLDRLTTVPPGPAAPVRVAVPVEVFPPITVVGESVKLESVAGVMVKLAVDVVPPWVAEITAVVVADTATVVTVNVAVEAPAGTVTVAGTVALGLPELRLTTVPPAAAFPLSVTVPVEGFPPKTAKGDSARPERIAGLTVSVADCAAVLPCVAVIVTVVELATGEVETVKVADVAPAATVTLDGTVPVEVGLADRLTTMPPVGAGPFRVTVPVDGVPPVTTTGDTESVETAGGLIVIVAVTVVPPAVAEIVDVCAVAKGTVLTVNVAEVAPAATLTVAGTVASVSPDDKLTTRPPFGALPLRVTVPTAELPPATVAGAIASDEGSTVFRTLLTKPEKRMGPQPDAVSQPAVAIEVCPFGSPPLLPDVMSLKTVESPLKE